MTAKSKKASWRTRLRLSQPFCRRIWDAAITINQFGWNFDLRTYNVVPYWSPIFYFCAVGDLATVQHLLQVGEAGLLDVRIDDDARDANGYMTLIEASLLLHAFWNLFKLTTTSTRHKLVNYMYVNTCWIRLHGPIILLS